MLDNKKIDKEIYEINKTIYKTIELWKTLKNEDGLLSQNLLSHLRNFLELIFAKICMSINNEYKSDFKDYAKIKSFKKELKSKHKYKNLTNFHSMLNIAVSHYTNDETNSKLFLFHIYENLQEIKELLAKEYNIQVFENIEDILPIFKNNTSFDFYSKVFSILYSDYCKKTKEQLFYLIKQKPIYLQGKIFYENSLSLANDIDNKSERTIMYSKEKINSNYSIKLNFFTENIDIFQTKLKINIIDKWEYSIRNCELMKLIHISNGKSITSPKYNAEFEIIMKYMKESKMDLLDIIKYNKLDDIKDKVMKSSSNAAMYIINSLYHFDKIIKQNRNGSNLVKYILSNVNNSILKNIISSMQCSNLSDLYVRNKCIPFDTLPLCTSLPNHNPNFYELLKIIDIDDIEEVEDQILYKKVLINCEKNSTFFCPISEKINPEKINNLKNKINNKFSPTHKRERELCVFKNNLYINGYLENFIFIKNKLIELANKKYMGMNEQAKKYIKEHKIDSEEKNKILEHIFENGSLLIIKGAAGTGKSHLINLISQVFDNNKKIYLTNTHSAKENLRIKISNNEYWNFMTVTKFINNNSLKETDILFIDECSTISNKDMCEVLKSNKFKLLILSGDSYQIESIRFGNWFNIIDKFVDKKVIVELLDKWRSKNKNLIKLWEYVRKFDAKKTISEISKDNISSDIGQQLYERECDDEICLCLNYDGLYGVNNINKLLQSKNQEKYIEHNTYEFKKNDPILFLESQKYKDVLHNNLKGKIIDIKSFNDKNIFTLEVEKIIDELQIKSKDIKIIEFTDDKLKTIIELTVFKKRNYDNNDEEESENILPFQIAYATTIHKAQGLEYESVKIVISDEVGEKISHNIFYTAITRSKENLKIFWSANSSKIIIDNFLKNKKNFKKDIDLINEYEKENSI